MCEGCESRLSRVGGSQQQVPLQQHGRHPFCEPAHALEQCRAALVFDDVSRPIIAALKYRRQHRLAEWLAEQAAVLVPQAADALTWIPATPDRKRQRGFDQGEELARHLSSYTGVPVRRLLDRHRSDRRQTGRTRTDRQAGPRLQARCHSPEFVVVVDDVVTTGSSMCAAAKELQVSGATRIIGVVTAATPSKRGVLSRGA